MTSFFWSCDKSEKCLRQIAHIACNCFLYSDNRHHINAVVVERLISKLSHYFGQYETATADWLVLDNNMSRISEITHAWLVPANVYYRSFGKLIEGLPHLKDFKAPIVKNSSPAKVVKILASSSSVNSFSGRSFGFVECPGCLSSVKEPPPLMEIERPPQPSINGVICPLFSIVNFVSNSNNEQF